MTGLTQTILIVDDVRDIRESLASYLHKHGFQTQVASDAAAARNLLTKSDFDLVILDIMMPGEDGLSLCRWLFANNETPVIFLTAMASETDRIVGLELGADDYVVKPFNPRELLARIRVALRRQTPKLAQDTSEIRQFDVWQHDPNQNRLERNDGFVVCLTTYENRLLNVLLDQPNTALSRSVLLRHVVNREEKVYDRAIDNQVGRLRRKIEIDPSNPRIIQTVWGGGYKLVSDVKTLKTQ